MKRFGKLFVTWLLLAALCVGGACAEVIDMIGLIATQGGGVVETVGEWLRIAGRRPDGSGDDFLITNHILGQYLDDYEWTFTYKPMSTDWNSDSFAFNSTNEVNEWDCYIFRVGGNKTDMPGLWLYKGEAKQEAFAVVDHYLEWNVAYDVKIDVEGQHVRVYFAKEGTLTDDTAPVMDVMLPATNDGYANEFISAGDFQIVSWAGDFYIKDMQVTFGEDEVIVPEAAEPVWYPHNTACAYGLHFREEAPGLTDKWYTYVPVDLSVNGTYTFDYVASNVYRIGTVQVDVNGDAVTVTYNNMYGGYGNTMTESEFFTFFPDLESVTTVDPENLTGFAFGQPISIQNDLGGDTDVLLYVRNVVTYCDHVIDGVKLSRLYSADREAIADRMRYVQNHSGQSASGTAIQGESGVVQTLTDGVRLAGRKADNSGDDYLNTSHILGEAVSDFDWTFTYTPNRVDWNQDRFFFRSVDENEWNGYCLFIGGFGVPENLRGLHLYKGEAYNAPIAALEYDFEEGVTYAVRILAEGKNVKVWFAPADEMTADTAPVFDVMLPDSGVDYANEYIEAGDFQIISWAGDFVISNMQVDVDR